MESPSEDIRAIQAVILGQFDSLNWTPETSGGQLHLRRFAIFGRIAVPARRQTLEEFIERMSGLAGSKLRSFKKAALGQEI